MTAAPRGDRLPDWRGYGRSELDAQYSPSRIAKDFAGALAGWQAGTAEARRRFAAHGRFDVGYGPGKRQRLDIFPVPDAPAPTPIQLFIHGGFWQELDKGHAGFPAPGFLAEGSAFVAVGYTLAPEARLGDIVAEIRSAAAWIRDNAGSFGGDPERIVVCGHSAGAYLAASLVAGPGAAPPAGLAGLVLVSGIYELAPIISCYVNDALRLTPDEATGLDLLSAVPVADIPVRIFVGAEETAEFRRHSAALLEAWRPHLSDIGLIALSGRDHFDILDDLAAVNGPIHRESLRLAGMLARPAKHQQEPSDDHR